MASTRRDEYWLHKGPEEVIGRLESIDANWESYTATPLRTAQVRNYMAYYSPALEPSSYDTSLMFEGIQGELVRMFSPKARVHLRQLMTLVTKQRLTFQATARPNATADVIKDLKLGNAVASYLVDTERLDVKDDLLVEGSLVCGSWFTKCTWRTDRGQKHATDGKRVIYTGAPEVTLASPFDVVYNVLIPYWELQPWVKVRTLKNRWDLIAQHPDMRQELLNVEAVAKSIGSFGWADSSVIDEDMIWVHELYVRPCPALPEGRMLVYASSKAWLFDDDNPYGTIPVEPCSPEMVLNTGAAYPMFTNLVACQEMFDNSMSALATNESAFAVQNVAVPRGADIQVSEIYGMRFLHYTPMAVEGGGLPKAMQLTASSPHTYKFLDQLGELLQELSLLNGAVIGKPPTGASGVAIATLSANAIEFINPIAKARTICWEKTMDHAINSYKVFSRVPTALPVRGKKGKVSHDTFKGDDLATLAGYKMDIANPLMQTTGGRLEVAQQLLQIPKEQWPDWVSILEGRPLTEITEEALSENDLIHDENEDLLAGETVVVMVTDDHPRHIARHAALLNNPKMRVNNPNVKAVTDHILEHYQQEMGMDPGLKAILRTGKGPSGGGEMANPGMPPKLPPGPPMPEPHIGPPPGHPPPPGPHPLPGGHAPHAELPLPQTDKVSNPRADLLGRSGPQMGLAS